jgi:type I restriction enzyme S subunit
MSNQWSQVRLGEVVREEREQVGAFDGDGLPVLGVTNIEGVTHTGVEASDDKSKYFRLRPGRFVYNPYRINVGSIGLSSATQDGICSPAYVVFAPTERIDANFLRYFLKSARGNQLINFHGNRGSVRSALRFDDLAGIEIPLPPLAEQRRVVARIEELATQIHEARTIRHQAAEEADALLTTARRTTISETRAKTVALEDACEAIIDNLHSNPTLSETGIPCVRSPDVGYGTLNLDSAQRTDEDEYRKRTVRGEPKADDIVLVREGGGTGKCAVVLPGQRFSLGQRVMMLRPNAERILPRFFLHQLLSPQIQEDQIAPLSKGSASPHLNIGTLRRFNLVLPPLPEQRRIVSELDALQAEVDALKRLQAETAAELAALLPAILDKAFKGEL